MQISIHFFSSSVDQTERIRGLLSLTMRGGGDNMHNSKRISGETSKCVICETVRRKLGESSIKTVYHRVTPFDSHAHSTMPGFSRRKPKKKSSFFEADSKGNMEFIIVQVIGRRDSQVFINRQENEIWVVEVQNDSDLFTARTRDGKDAISDLNCQQLRIVIINNLRPKVLLQSRMEVTCEGTYGRRV